MDEVVDWRTRYLALAASLSATSKDTSSRGIFLCGMSASVDGLVSMHDMQPLLDAHRDTPAGEFADMLLKHVLRGTDGEVRLDWPQGPAWLRDNLKIRYALGGTGPQAAWVLARLGAQALISLEDRHPHMLRQIPDGVLIAQDGEAMIASDIRPTEMHVPEIFIFEFTAGQQIGDVIPQRSSRIIVRFCDRGIQNDRDFLEMSKSAAPGAAAGLLSGLNDEPIDRMEVASHQVFNLARAWKAAGLKTIHFELACYDARAPLDAIFANARGAITSLGMSHSELLAIDPSATNPMDAMTALAERLELERVCVHADTWAASVTLDDPALERRALMAGCAVAAARAANGSPVAAVTIDPRAKFLDVPFETCSRNGKWSFVACAAPYLEKPATTLGLGDSFTAGCLLILGQEHARTESAGLPHA